MILPVHPLGRILIYNIVIAFLGAGLMATFESWGVFILINATLIIVIDLLQVFCFRYLAKYRGMRLSILEPWASIFYYVITVVLVVLFLL